MAAKRAQRKPARSPAGAPAEGPSRRSLLGAAGLAAASGGWALHLWRQLVLARAGGEVTCPFDAQGGCADVWSSAWALAVERATQLPIAAHGVLWSLVALALPLAVLAARARGRTGEVSFAAMLATGAAGVVASLVLASVQVAEGGFCASCTVQYVLVLAYAGVCVVGMARVGAGVLARGAGLAAACALVAGVALAALGPRAPEAPSAAAHAPAAPGGAAGGEAPTDLAAYLASLPPPVAQAVSNALRDYESAPAKPLREPRALVGSPMAPIRITDFADLLCSHCASLHATLAQLRHEVPPELVAIESRYFPLDGHCNPHIPHASQEGVGCAAARALVCLEGDPRAFDVAGQIYARQRGLTAEDVFALAAPLRARESLAACMASPETEAKLRDDIAWAEEHGIQGTPLVLVNGRRASSFGAFLYALALAGGDPDHPAFAALPPPSAGRAAGG